MISGKGYFIWEIQKCAPDAQTLVLLARQAGLEHVLIKIADGDTNFPLPDKDPGGRIENLTREAIEACRTAGIEVWGWSFVYGQKPDPADQARKFAARLNQFGLKGGVINAENLGTRRWTAKAARDFMSALLAEIPVSETLLALSTYRFPSVQGSFPFNEFLEHCQIAMPQVYWVAKSGGNPISNLTQSVQEYNERFQGKLLIPTGAAYAEHYGAGNDTWYWTARPDQITMFLNQAQALDVPAVNFWSWQHARGHNNTIYSGTELWDAVARFPFASTVIEPGEEITVGPGGTGFAQGVYSNIPDATLSTFVRAGKTVTWATTQQHRSTMWTQWVPALKTSGAYEVEVWVPGDNATTKNARYHVHGVVGEDSVVVVSLDQSRFFDQYVRLGFFEFDANNPQSGMISANNLTMEDRPLQIAFGDIRWGKVEHILDIRPGYADGFDAPVGTEEERRSNQIWPGLWTDANEYLHLYDLGYHTGADLNLNPPGDWDADKKAPVYAIADGTVTYAQKADSSWGNLVIIRHDPIRTPQGDIVAYSRYGHLDVMRVKANNRVRRGDQIGNVGNAFGRWPYHLHFDISTSGRLEQFPTDWPGFDSRRVERDYVDPRLFIEQHRPPRS